MKKKAAWPWLFLFLLVFLLLGPAGGAKASSPEEADGSLLTQRMEGNEEETDQEPETLDKEKLEKIDAQLEQLQKEAESNAQLASEELAQMEKELNAARRRATLLLIAGVVTLLSFAGWLIFRQRHSGNPEE